VYRKFTRGSVSKLSLRKCVSEERIEEQEQLEGLIHIGVGGESKLLRCQILVTSLRFHGGLGPSTVCQSSLVAQQPLVAGNATMDPAASFCLFVFIVNISERLCMVFCMLLFLFVGSVCSSKKS
jgi:hypothetical protein